MPIDISERILQPQRKPVKLHPIRRLVQVAIGVVLVALPLTNVFRVDVTSGRFWLLGQSLSAQNLILLFYGCAIGAVLLLSVSMVYGRWWCGWVCPQTLASDFADSLRQRIDRLFHVASGGFRRIFAQVSWSVAMVITAIATAAVVLSFFYPVARVWHAVFQPWTDSRVTVHLAIVSAVIGADLLWVRRHFCRRGCPYGVMLSLIGDKNTMTVRYLWERDEDCIKCAKCVTICPMGIDIKAGANQMECIGCGECIDACNDILPLIKSNPKPGLIELRYGVDPMRTTNRMTFLQRIGLWDVRRGFVCLVTCLLIVGFFNEMYGTRPTTVTVIPNGAISSAGGFLFETYVLAIANGKPADISYQLTPSGIGHLFLNRRNPVVRVARSADKTFLLTLAAPIDSLRPGQRYPITIEVRPLDGSNSRNAVKSFFYVPELQAQMKAG